MNISNLKIGTRLLTGYGVLLALLLAIAVLGLHSMAGIQGRLRNIAEINNAEMRLAVEMQNMVTDRMIALRNLALLTEEADMKPEVERIQKGAERYANAARQLEQMLGEHAGTPQEKQLLADIGRVAQEAQGPMDKAAKLGLANEAESATRALLVEVRPVQRQWVGKLTELVELEDKLTKATTEEAERSYTWATRISGALSVAALLLGCASAHLTARSITRPLNAAVQVAREVAAGNLTVAIPAAGRDETGQLLGALGDMTESLRAIVVQVRAGTDNIAMASSEIADGNLDLSSRTEQQAGALEETASSIEELTAAVAHNADNARHANQLAAATSEVAAQGGAVVTQVVDTMTAIDVASKKIVDIIAVIDGIAFQTKIFALNAAVEAARAGEQGRGFAVVASEVRNLAQRSATAAREIKTLIGESVEQVNAGGALVARAGATIQQVVDSVGRVTSVVAEISAATVEQETGIGQINQAVIEMDSVTQQNAALVEEAAAAAASLQTQAKSLADLVSTFRLG